MNDLALCGNCCWIGNESELSRTIDNNPVNASLKSIIIKNDLECYSVSCPVCGSSIIYRKRVKNNFVIKPIDTTISQSDVSIPSTWEAKQESEENSEIDIKKDTKKEDIYDLEDDDLDADLVDSVLAQASSIDINLPEKGDIPKVTRPPKLDRNVKCDRCGKNFIIPSTSTFSGRRCPACMNELRRLMGE